jgi:Amylo-alpha-1,6-glucosidase
VFLSRADEQKVNAPAGQTLVFDSNVDAYNAAYQKARRVIENDIRDGKFIAGKGWPQVWTRDSSFSTDLALALFQPKASLETLLGLKEEVPGIGECWIQDFCGHFGGWPNLSDSIVGAIGAWQLYLVSGDEANLRTFYQRTVNSLKRAEKDAYQPETGLFGGCSSFMESNSAYPAKYAMNGGLVGKTAALSNVALYYQGYVIAALMADRLGENGTPFREKAEALKKAINKHFWQEDRGFYGYFLDENRKLSPGMEGLGEALCVKFGIAGEDQARRILDSTPTTQHGYPCLWPQWPEYMNYGGRNSSFYHNGMIWPFVQGYWAWGAADRLNLPKFQDELRKLTELSQKTDTFQEFYLPENGRPKGSQDQLWSASGYLSMITHGLVGMNFEENGIRFAPVVPSTVDSLSLKGIPYRGSTLDVNVSGHGTRILGFLLDGKPLQKPFLDSSLKGAHRIEIQLDEPGLFTKLVNRLHR